MVWGKYKGGTSWHGDGDYRSSGVFLPPVRDMLYGACMHISRASCVRVSGRRRRTRTFFALQMRHARLRTVPSASTTSGANSMPNLFLD